MADKNRPQDEAESFQLYDNGPKVSADPTLAAALQKNGNAGFVNGDTRRSDQVTTLDSLGIARTSSFEQQFADKTGGGRVPGAERLRGDLAPAEDASTDVGVDYVGTVGATGATEVVEVSEPATPVADKPVESKATRSARK